MPTHLFFFLYGCCTMFYGMMAWLFWRKADRLSNRVALLMTTISVQCVKDLFFLDQEHFVQPAIWSLVTAADLVAIPMYYFILCELVKPGKLTRRHMVIHELPFLVLLTLLALTQSKVLYFILIIWGGCYGTYFMLWTTLQIPRYHRQLKERFSYTENINLNWLRTILYAFYVLLALYGITCLIFHIEIEALYLTGALIGWMLLCFFLYKHQSVIEELKEVPPAMEDEEKEEPSLSDIGQRILPLFEDEHIFLNPSLKVSDIATAIGSNRTYVSNYFNREIDSSFYDFVNGYRIRYACQLLQTTDESVKCIAEKAGFNSPQTFIRVFTKTKGMSPTHYRTESAGMADAQIF